jgi:hypothetical protein
MQKRRDSGSRFGAAAAASVVLLCAALWGFTGCEGELEESGENKITAFKIGDRWASIDEPEQELFIIVPADTDLTKLKPVITVSENASVSPGSEAEVNISMPLPYTVTAENGVTRTYTVTVSKDDPVQKSTSGVEISWPNAADKQPVIYGLPEKANPNDPDFKLSRRGRNDLPYEIVISAGGHDARDPAIYDVSGWWYVDNSFFSNDNIITIYASNYTLKQPHYITFIGTKDDVEYSTTLTFTVQQ